MDMRDANRHRWPRTTARAMNVFSGRRLRGIQHDTPLVEQQPGTCNVMQCTCRTWMEGNTWLH